MQAPAAGFSLIELMVAVAIVAILLTVAAPAMQRFMTGRAVVAEAEELTSTLRLARSDAQRLANTVSVCPAADVTASEPACSGSDAWGTGWLTFIDLDGDGARDATGGERVLRVHASLPAIEGIDGGGARFVSFSGHGLARSGAAEFSVKPRMDEADERYAAVSRQVCLGKPGRALLRPGTEACP